MGLGAGCKTERAAQVVLRPHVVRLGRGPLLLLWGLLLRDLSDTNHYPVGLADTYLDEELGCRLNNDDQITVSLSEFDPTQDDASGAEVSKVSLEKLQVNHTTVSIYFTHHLALFIGARSVRRR